MNVENQEPRSPPIEWPVKTREMHNHHMDSTRWNHFNFRDGDIVVATYAKSGTTWMQQIVSQLIFRGSEEHVVGELSPWLDLRIIPQVVIDAMDRQTHRRVVKTHLPVDALVYSPKAKYIFVGRDGRDAVWSLFNHHINATDEYFSAFTNTPGRVGPGLERGDDDVVAFYRGWLERDGFPYWPAWENIRSWWSIRSLPNIKFVHFNDLKKDLAGSVQDIALFLNIHPDAADLKKIVEHCTFDYMKSHAEHMAPRGGSMWNGGATTFINKGTNGRWRDVLSVGDIAAYQAKSLAEFGPQCAHWLENGGKLGVVVDPR
jgi:aryl sulfotransferase